MDFVNRLKVEHLQSFWYFASKTGFALVSIFGSLLWATSPSREEAEFYRLRLAEYRWTLTVSSKWARFIGSAIGTLDRSRQMLERNLEEKPSSLSGNTGSFNLFGGEEEGRKTSVGLAATLSSSSMRSGQQWTSAMEPYRESKESESSIRRSSYGSVSPCPSSLRSTSPASSLAGHASLVAPTSSSTDHNPSKRSIDSVMIDVDENRGR